MKTMMATLIASAALGSFAHAGTPTSPNLQQLTVNTAKRTLVGTSCELEFGFSGQPNLSGIVAAACNLVTETGHPFTPVPSTGSVVTGLNGEPFIDCQLLQLDRLQMGFGPLLSIELACADEN